MGKNNNVQQQKIKYRKANKETPKKPNAETPSVSAASKKESNFNEAFSLNEPIKWTDAGAVFTVAVKTLSPVHLSSGQADVNVDSDVVHDRYGVPYFPAKRLKGLLYESAVEVKEMAEAAGMAFINQRMIDELFQHTESDLQMVVKDLRLQGYEELKGDLAYLEERYPGYIRKEDVLQEFTSIRYQTAINKESGTALKGSLRNIRIVDAGLEFFGEWEIKNAGKEHLKVLALAMQNLSFAGGKRNRGFGQISCAMAEQKQLVEQAMRKDAV